MIFDAIEGREVVIADCFLLAWQSSVLAVVETQIDHQKSSINDFYFLCFVPNGELYVDGNGDSKCLGVKSECKLISDFPNNPFGSK